MQSITPLRISHFAPPYVHSTRFGASSCLLIVVTRENQSYDKASNLSLVYKALPYVGIEHSSDSETHHLI